MRNLGICVRMRGYQYDYKEIVNAEQYNKKYLIKQRINKRIIIEKNKLHEYYNKLSISEKDRLAQSYLSFFEFYKIHSYKSG